MGENRNAHRVLSESVRERKRLLGRPRCTRVDNSDVGCTKVGWFGEEWFNLASDRDKWRALQNTVVRNFLTD
jgi:hypothetical protein